MIRILFITLLTFSYLFSNVRLIVPQNIVSGEPLKFIIEYSGSEEPIFPNIDKIAGFSVQNAGKSNQISIVNGNRTQKVSQSYVLFPNKDVTIPSFEIKTTNDSFQTESKIVKITTAAKTQSSDVDLSLNVDKSSLYVGESLVLTLKLKYKSSLDIVNMELNQPNFDGYWAKSLGKGTRDVEGEYETQTLTYILFPQRSGKQSIEPVSINIAFADMRMRNYSFFTPPTKTKRFYSNKIDLDVKPLPENLKLIGDFKIEASIDKNEVKLGDAVSYKLEISGTGNLDDIEDIKLNIPNATIYENKPNKNYNFNDGKYGGVYTKSFSIVADSSFKIPAIKLEYFDQNQKIKKVITTKEFEIKVLGAQQKQQEAVLQKSEPEKKIVKELVVNDVSYQQKLLFFIFGLICGILLIFILYYLKKKNSNEKDEDKPLIKVVKSISNKNELLKVLAPYITKDEEFDKLIYSIEDIDDTEFKTLKKEIVIKLKKLSF